CLLEAGADKVRDFSPPTPAEWPDNRERWTRGPRFRPTARQGVLMQPDSVGRPPPPPGSSGGPAIRLPPVIGVLLLLLVLVTALMQFASPMLEAEIVITFALYLFLDGQFQWQRLYSLVTSVFLHDGWLHLLFNGLWIATLGSLVHRVLGNVGFLLLFFASAIAGGLVYTFVHWGETALAIGASGGVFGLIGAFGHLGIARPGQP